jgi:hypothetical protein
VLIGNSHAIVLSTTTAATATSVIVGDDGTASSLTVGNNRVRCCYNK